jgi:hypothetical protein
MEHGRPQWAAPAKVSVRDRSSYWELPLEQCDQFLTYNSIPVHIWIANIVRSASLVHGEKGSHRGLPLPV